MKQSPYPWKLAVYMKKRAICSDRDSEQNSSRNNNIIYRYNEINYEANENED